MHEIVIDRSDARFHMGSRFRVAPRWIVVHYTGSANASAASVVSYLRSTDRVISTHFVVDEHDIIGVVPESRVAYHVGSGACARPRDCSDMKLQDLKSIYAHDWRYDIAACNHLTWQACGKDFLGNREALGVDLCVKKRSTKSLKATDRDWYFAHDTVDNAAKLIAHLMTKHNVPLDRVIRHADATGKPCPRPFVTLPNDDAPCGYAFDEQWNEFKRIISLYLQEGVKEA